MGLLNYIIWTANPEIFPSLDWPVIGNIRWYGLLFAVAFIVGQQIMIYIFKKENKPDKDIETLTIYMVVATIIGARLGHVFFYEPLRFLANPLEIFMIQKGGLASHGAAAGILIGIWMYSNYYIKIGFSKPHFVWKKRKREGQRFLWVIDRIVIVAALGGCLIRTGNFMNSEIIGHPTDAPTAVLFARDIIDRFEYDKNVADVKIYKRGGEEASGRSYPINIQVEFENNNYQENQLHAYIQRHFKYILTEYPYVAMHVDEKSNDPLNYSLTKRSDGRFTANIKTNGVARHPSQLYEAFTSLLLFFLLLWLWFQQKDKIPYGRIFGLFLVILFGLRFFHELFKENQVEFEATIPLNMGQWLSIPLIIAGAIILLRSYMPQNKPPDIKAG